MATSDAQPFPIKNRALYFEFPLIDSTGALKSAAGSLDSEISKDGGAFSDCTNEAVEIGSSGIYYLDLTATEMNANVVAVVVKSAGALAQPFIIYPVDIAEPAGAPAFGAGGGGLEEVLAWLLALSRNKMTQTDTTTTLRNNADSADISTSAVSAASGTFTRGEFT